MAFPSACDFDSRQHIFLLELLSTNYHLKSCSKTQLFLMLHEEISVSLSVLLAMREKAYLYFCKQPFNPLVLPLL